MIEAQGPIQIATVRVDDNHEIVSESELFIGKNATVAEALQAAVEGGETTIGGALGHNPPSELVWLEERDHPATIAK